jgi:hypothetical protein
MSASKIGLNVFYREEEISACQTIKRTIMTKASKTKPRAKTIIHHIIPNKEGQYFSGAADKT